ncbi:MAG: hypothetical protein ABI587_05570 [Gemmatimonadales bacterium]
MPGSLALTYLARGVWIWALIRIVAAVGVRMMHTIDSGARSGTMAPLLVASALCVIDFRRRRESVLVANLGIAPMLAVAVSLIPVFVGEAVVRGFDLP